MSLYVYFKINVQIKLDMTRITFNFLQMFAFYMLLQVTFAFRILSANIMITLATRASTMSVTLVLPANTMVTLFTLASTMVTMFTSCNYN